MENVLGLVESEAFQHMLTDMVVHHVRPMEVGGRLVALPPTSMSKGNRCGLIDYNTTRRKREWSYVLQLSCASIMNILASSVFCNWLFAHW